MNNIEFSDIVKAFNNNGLIVFDDSSKFKDYLNSMNFNNSVLLMMSSGNFENIDYNDLQKLLLN
jgi:UDP-N-acetylmuramate-alanine ligase